MERKEKEKKAKAAAKEARAKLREEKNGQRESNRLPPLLHLSSVVMTVIIPFKVIYTYIPSNSLPLN